MKKSGLALAFAAGFMGNIVASGFIPIAIAEVSGMNYYDLKRDRDFKKAVQYVVEDCGGSGYTDGDEYVYTISISC